MADGSLPAASPPAAGRRRRHGCGGGREPSGAAWPAPARPSSARPGPARPAAPRRRRCFGNGRSGEERPDPARRTAEAEGMAPAARGGKAGPGVARGGLGAGGFPPPPPAAKGGSSQPRPSARAQRGPARSAPALWAGKSVWAPLRGSGGPSPASPENPSSGRFCYGFPVTLVSP